MEGSKNDCTVSGALSLVLSFCQITGLAPISFIGKRNGRWIIDLSSNLRVYSIVFITILNGMTVMALTFDCLSKKEDSVRLGSPIITILNIIDILIVCLVSSIGVYGSTTRLRNIMKYLNKMETLDAVLKDFHDSKYSEKRKCAYIILVIISWIVIAIVDFYIFFHNTTYGNKDWRIAALYSGYSCQYVVTVILELQLVFTIILISSYLQYSNDSLKQLLENIKHQINSKSITTVSSKSVDISHESDHTATDSNRHQPSISAYETIQNAGLICDFIDDVIGNFVNSNGILMMLLLLCILFHLVITPFYLIIAIFSSGNIIWFMLLEVSWLCLHLNNLIMIMEPCHQTHEEMNRTKVLLSELFRITTSKDPIYSELKVFSRQLQLNETRYCPLGLYVFGRPLVAKIFANTLSYMIIILQLQDKS